MTTILDNLPYEIIMRVAFIVGCRCFESFPSGMLLSVHVGRATGDRV